MRLMGELTLKFFDLQKMQDIIVKKLDRYGLTTKNYIKINYPKLKTQQSHVLYNVKFPLVLDILTLKFMIFQKSSSDR